MARTCGRKAAAFGSRIALAAALSIGSGTSVLAAPPQEEDSLLPGMGNTGAAGESSDEFEELIDLDLEDLLEVECTVVSRTSEDLQSAAAAVYIIKGDEIRRAGHTSVQEALRMVPGTFVSRWSSSNWDVTIRGFGPGVSDANQAYLNQVLVMIDGVVVYTPLFAGMWWGLQDLDVDHIDRIEVVRGPSGVLWGANAFQGLIHIITKDSAETQGHRLSARASNDNQFVTLRTSGEISEGLTYSAFARRTRYDGIALGEFFTSGGATSDMADWGINSGGFQFDGRGEEDRRWRFWARGYDADVGELSDPLFGPVESLNQRQHGGQVGFQFDDPGSGISVRTGYVKDRQALGATDSRIDIDQVQLEARRTVALSPHNQLMFGVGFDRVDSDTNLFDGLAVDSIVQNNARAFVSDTWTLPAQHLALTLGIQAIDHEFSGFDLQPSARLSWTPPGGGTYWLSGSRAVRTPSIEEEAFGDGTLDAQSVVAAEAGWRGRIMGGVSMDLALYYSDFEDVRVRSFDPVTFLDTYTNEASGQAKGGELAVDIQATDDWTLRAAYSFQASRHGPKGLDPDVDFVDTQYPAHLFNLRSYYTLAEDWELDTGLYMVERFDVPSGFSSPEYLRVDARLGWQAREGLRLALGAQGLNDPLRSEFGEDEIRRLFYVTLELLR